MVCAVGQHGNGINKKINRGRDGGRHGCDYLGHQISTAMRASGGDRGFLLKESQDRKECVISRRPCGRPRSSKRSHIASRWCWEIRECW